MVSKSYQRQLTSSSASQPANNICPRPIYSTNSSPTHSKTYTNPHEAFLSSFLFTLFENRRPRPLMLAPANANNYNKQLHVETSVEYDLPAHIYPPKNAAPILIIHPEYTKKKRKSRPATANPTQYPNPSLIHNFLPGALHSGIGTVIGTNSTTKTTKSTNINNTSSFIHDSHPLFHHSLGSIPNNTYPEVCNGRCGRDNCLDTNAKVHTISTRSSRSSSQRIPTVSLISPINSQPKYQSQVSKQQNNKLNKSSTSKKNRPAKTTAVTLDNSDSFYQLQKQNTSAAVHQQHQKQLQQQQQAQLQQHHQQVYPVPPPSYATATGMYTPNFVTAVVAAAAQQTICRGQNVSSTNFCSNNASNNCISSSTNMDIGTPKGHNSIGNGLLSSTASSTPMIAAVPPEIVPPHAISTAHIVRSRGSPKLRPRRYFASANVPDYQRRPRSNTVGHTSSAASTASVVTSVAAQQQIQRQQQTSSIRNQYSNYDVSAQQQRTSSKVHQEPRTDFSKLDFSVTQHLDRFQVFPETSHVQSNTNLNNSMNNSGRSVHHQQQLSNTSSNSSNNNSSYLCREQLSALDSRMPKPRIADTAQMFSAPITPAELMEEGNHLSTSKTNHTASVYSTIDYDMLDRIFFTKWTLYRNGRFKKLSNHQWLPA